MHRDILFKKMKRTLDRTYETKSLLFFFSTLSTASINASIYCEGHGHATEFRDKLLKF